MAIRTAIAATVVACLVSDVFATPRHEPTIAPAEREVLVLNPARATETVESAPAVNVSVGQKYRLSITFEGRAADLVDRDRLRRVAVFQRKLQRAAAHVDCSVAECWERVALFNSRDGASQSVVITPKAAKLLVVAWFVTDGSKSRAGTASQTGCSSGVCEPGTLSGGRVEVPLTSPYGTARLVIVKATAG